jgi:hypothetical protein
MERQGWLRAGVGLVMLAALTVLVACGGVGESVGSVATQGAALASTAQAAATQAAPAVATAAAAGGQIAGTAQALATQAGPAAATAAVAAQDAIATARAAATEVAPMMPTVGTAAARAMATMQAALTHAPAGLPAVSTPVVVPGVGSAGPIQIAGVRFGLTGVAVTLRNGTPAALDLSGWGLRVGGATARLPANTRLAPGGSLTIHTGAGTSGGEDVYLGEAAGALIANLRPGASIALVDAQGQVVSEFGLP